MSSATRYTTIVILLTLANASTSSEAQESSSGPLSRLMDHIRQHRSAKAVGTPPATAQAGLTTGQPNPCDCAAGSDPYGFAAILNRFRAAAGLRPLAYDPQLSSWASQNNAAQCRWGIGHHVNPYGVQNCGWNYVDASAVAQGWMNSPGHRRNMLSSEVSQFGIAFGPGPYWTLNAR